MIDKDGYRPNVAIILCNAKNEVFWGKRIREHSWQFPQGGIKHGEAPEDAMYRELEEETGLRREHVRILGRTKSWLHYNVPSHWVKREWRGTYKGQKQIWYLLRLTGRDNDIRLRASEHPEFDAWRWHDYWVPLDSVIEFKRDVYRKALHQLVRYLDRPPRVSPRTRSDRHPADNGPSGNGSVLVEIPVVAVDDAAMPTDLLLAGGDTLSSSKSRPGETAFTQTQGD
ncbi:MAG: RNA pyrophosphohydrolase [Burkholderiales bacterium]|nr:RNA pyrophosphohydrolase [Rhodocyclaceae bacterium]